MSAYKKFNQAVTDFDKLQRLRYGMECYADALNGRTQYSEEASKVIQIAMESIDPEFDIKEGSAVTLRALKEGVKLAAKAAADIIAYLWNTLKALYVKFTGSIRSVRRHQAQISKRLGKLGSRTTYEKMNVAGIQRLSLDGEFVGAELSNLDDIRSTTDYILNQYPKSVIKISRDTSRYFLNAFDNMEGHSQEEIARECMSIIGEILQRDFRPPPGHKPVSTRELSTGERGVNRGEILPGNVAFIFTTPQAVAQGLASNPKDPIDILQKGFVMQFSELQLNVADRSEREIPVPSVDKLKELTEVISRILTLAERGEDGIRDFNSVKTVVDDAIRQIAAKVEASEDKVTASTALHMIGVISKKLAEPMGHYTHWLAITLNVYLTFIGHCIDHYESSGV